MRTRAPSLVCLPHNPPFSFFTPSATAHKLRPINIHAHYTISAISRPAHIRRRYLSFRISPEKPRGAFLLPSRLYSFLCYTHGKRVVKLFPRNITTRIHAISPLSLSWSFLERVNTAVQEVPMNSERRRPASSQRTKRIYAAVIPLSLKRAPRRRNESAREGITLLSASSLFFHEERASAAPLLKVASRSERERKRA